jgi:hypothetical protein
MGASPAPSAHGGEHNVLSSMASGAVAAEPMPLIEEALQVRRCQIQCITTDVLSGDIPCMLFVGKRFHLSLSSNAVT